MTWLSWCTVPGLLDSKTSSLLHMKSPTRYMIGVSSVQKKSVKMLGLTDAHSFRPPFPSCFPRRNPHVRLSTKMDCGLMNRVWEWQLLTGTERTRGQLGKEVAFVEQLACAACCTWQTDLILRQPTKAGIIIFALQMRKLKCREVEEIAQSNLEVNSKDRIWLQVCPAPKSAVFLI